MSERPATASLLIRMGHRITHEVVEFNRRHDRPGNALKQFEAEFDRIVEDEVERRLAERVA